jgi:hypothetical protein
MFKICELAELVTNVLINIELTNVGMYLSLLGMDYGAFQDLWNAAF